MKLRTRLTLMLLALALVPLVVATLLIAGSSTRRLRAEALQYQLAAGGIVVADVTRALLLARSELETLASLVSDVSLAAADRQRIARAALLRANRIDALTVYRADGQSVLTLVSDARGSEAAPGALPAAVRERAQKQGFDLGKAAVRGSGAKRHVLALLVVPMWRGAGRKDRTLHGFVAAPLLLDHLSRIVASVSRERFSKRADRIFIIDATLTVIAAHDIGRVGKSARSDPAARDLALGNKGRVRSRGFGYISEYARSGEALLGTMTTVPTLGWHVVVEQSRARALASVRSTWITAATIAVGAAVFAVVLGLLLAGGVARPVSAVASAARRVAGGDFDARVPGDKRGDEVGEMARAFNVMSDDLRSYRERVVEETRIRADLSRYLSAELVESVVSQKTELRLGGDRRQVTVLFADVVAFTPMAEKHKPEEVVAILNELFTFLTEIVFKHGGVVDKFIGDCVMAVFGVPESRDDDADRAVSAALEMMQWLDVGNAKWRRDLGAELALGIGINSGEVVAGNLGSEKRMEYTVIGDTVNVAARLETLAQAGQVLVGEDTASMLDEDDYELEDLGEHPVAGRARAVRVFEVKE
ncbi:MAG: HAMP domain-containing protein [Myxococcales bacterium]|nr:HAMP domain-containing protein [Myxococcales bacterium]